MQSRQQQQQQLRRQAAGGRLPGPWGLTLLVYIILNPHRMIQRGKMLGTQPRNRRKHVGLRCVSAKPPAVVRSSLCSADNTEALVHIARRSHPRGPPSACFVRLSSPTITQLPHLVWSMYTFMDVAISAAILAYVQSTASFSSLVQFDPPLGWMMVYNVYR